MIGDKDADRAIDELEVEAAVGWLVMPFAVVCGIVIVVLNRLGVIDILGGA